MQEPTHAAIFERLGEFGGKIAALETNSANTWGAVTRIEEQLNNLAVIHAKGDPALTERVRVLEVSDGVAQGAHRAHGGFMVWLRWIGTVLVAALAGTGSDWWRHQP